MQIILENIGRRFNREWIFRNVNYTFTQGESYAVLGPNGSGKSTLLQVVNGSLTPSEGQLNFKKDSEILRVEDVYEHLSLAAPYLELIEEFTLKEMIAFHFKFKKLLNGINQDNLIGLLGMQKSANKAIRYFSSEMKQRLKLALAFCSDTPILMLDEPTSNLDTQGVDWYLNLIQEFAQNRLTIICSNQHHEYSFCRHQLNVVDYK